MRTTDLAQVRAWLQAAERGDQAALTRLLAAGVPINSVDEAGRTALFYAVATVGDSLAIVRWLMDHGADPSTRDRDGRTAIEYGALHMADGAEHSRLMEARRILAEAGRPRFLAVEEALGRWRVVGGGDDGRLVTISRGRIGGELRPLALIVDRIALDARGRVELSGDHAGLIVDVTLERLAEDGANLTWQDGVTFNAEYRLRR